MRESIFSVETRRRLRFNGPLKRSILARGTDLVLRISLLTSLLLMLAGCGSLKYGRAWSAFETSGADPLEGRWQGVWRSEWNDHSGQLRCMLSREGPRRYLAWFHARYARIFSFQYKTVFTVTEDQAGMYRLEGEQDLGKLAGGLYRYAAAIQGDDFQATYEAANGDHGVFELLRVE